MDAAKEVIAKTSKYAGVDAISSIANNAGLLAMIETGFVFANAAAGMVAANRFFRATDALLDSGASCNILNKATVLTLLNGQPLMLSETATRIRGVNGALHTPLGRISFQLGPNCVLDCLVMEEAQNLISTSQLLDVPNISRVLLINGDEVYYVNQQQVLYAEKRNGLWIIDLINPNSTIVPFNVNM